MNRRPRDRFAVEGTIYLVHFTVPLIRGGTSGVRHYLGWCEKNDQQRRLNRHACGDGARITAAAIRAGAELIIVRTWIGDRYLERKMKRRGRFSELCSICQQEKELVN